MISSAGFISKSEKTALFEPWRCLSAASGAKPRFAIGREVNAPSVINTGNVRPFLVRRNLYLRTSSPPLGANPVPRASRLPLLSRTTNLSWSFGMNRTTIRWLIFSERVSRIVLMVSIVAAVFAITVVGQLPN